MPNAHEREVFARNFNYYLNELGMNQRQFAEMLGVSPATVSHWSQARKMPHTDRIRQMATLFGCQMADLLEQPGENEPADFRNRMQKEYGVLFSMIDKATPEQRAQIESIIGVIVGNE